MSVQGSGSARVELRSFCLEVLGWNAAVAAFLAVYVTRYGAPVEAVAAHLRVMLLPLLGLTLIRLAIARIVPARCARFAIAALAAWLIGALLSYYAVVLLGLEAWGRVISWDLIAGYAGQLPMLVDALGLSLPGCVAGAAGAYLAMAALLWLYLRHQDWAGMLAAKLSLPMLGCVLGVAVLALAIEIYRIATDAGGTIGEPVSLTLRPLEGARDLQGHAVDALRARALDAAEDEVRARYVPAGAARRRNVVLIVVDALRPDHMGLFGYSRDTTPRLSALARNGALRAAMELHAVCASSFCGLLGIASSRFVHQFSERPITLQEVLKRHGYRIHMLLSGDHTTYYGLKHVYGNVDSYFDGHDGRAGRYVNDDGLLLDRVRHRHRCPSAPGTE